VDAAAGPDEDHFARQVSPSDNDEEKAGNDRDAAWRWRDPYPLSENCFFVANRKSLCVMDGHGRCEVIYTLSDSNVDMWAHEPRPVMPRPREPVVTPRTNWTQPTGRLLLADVTLGRNMRGVKPGEIKKLLVLETLPKPLNFSGSQEPITINGTFTLPRILGTVPVEADGSAYFEVPALRPLFFVALDEHDLAVKRMQSFVSVMPGETTSCVGCHEQRTRTPVNVHGAPQALQRAPSRISPIVDVPQVFDFPRDIQPILDKHCVACHNYEKYDGRLTLTGDRGPVYSSSYSNIFARNLVAEGRDGAGNRPPRDIGSSASRLLKFLDSRHYQVALTAREVTTIRLWIEAGGHYPGTYAALGTGMVRPNSKDREEVLTRRCATCHVEERKEQKEQRTWTFGFADDHYFNVSRPEKSLLLLAPLGRESGGFGLCRERTRFGKVPTPDAPLAKVFLDKADPDYKALLNWILAMETDLNRIKRFDMPGFKPNEHYVREMKRYGILPAGFDFAKDPIDVYETDGRYWQSFWYRPSSPSL
jgi:cytochrome c553